MQKKIFFMTFQVVPSKCNEHYDRVQGAFAHCLVLDNDPQSAHIKARFYVSKCDWDITKIEYSPTEAKEQNFGDIGLELYRKAQKEGIALAFVGWSKDGKSTYGPIQLKSGYRFDLENYLNKIKSLKNKGRCLHYDRGKRCGSIINAHSIQKSGSLSAIAENGKVYVMSNKFVSPRNDKRHVKFIQSGISKVSTFLGFCKTHDNELFEPIDKYPLIPTEQQVFLYAYRSICRELFVKENASALLESQLNSGPDQKAIKEFLLNMKRGTDFGLRNLQRHKAIYDLLLDQDSFLDMKYVLFLSSQQPTIAFSGLIYPDFDFMGRQLQDLGDHKENLELLAFCSAPYDLGWAFLFAWHKSSSKICVDFMRSLATSIHSNDKIGDYLFRLVFSNCENLAISPSWWDGLSDNQRENILSKVEHATDPMSVIKPSYLMDDLEGISNWKFESVISVMD